jgi:invasion protein IalB
LFHVECLTTRCLMRLPLTDAVTAALKNGKILAAAFDIGDQKMILPVSLAGIGLPLAKADL